MHNERVQREQQAVESGDAEALHAGPPVLADSLAPPLTPPDARHAPFRSLELDGLRGIAILLVMLFHTPATILTGAVHSEFSRALLDGWSVFHDSGWAGVDLFFTLSGFLITRNLLASRDRPHYYRNFYMRRVLRITPLYLLTLVLVLLRVHHSGPYVLLSFFYLANFAPAFGVVESYPVLWSLCIEEHFYLVWPTLVRRLNRRHAAYAGVALCVLTPVARAIAYHLGHFNPLYSWYRFDGFMYGALVAILFAAAGDSKRNLLRWSRGAALCVLAVIAVGLPFHIYTRFSLAGTALLYSVIAASASAIIAYALARPGSRLLALLRNPFLRLMGDVSYWVYLIHNFFLWSLQSWLDSFQRQHPAAAAQHAVLLYAGLLLSLGLLTVSSGIVVRKYFELPILSLKRYF